MSPRSRPLWYSLAGLIAAWAIAYGGFALVRHLKPSPAKIRALLQSTDLSKLSPEERRKAIRRLAELLNALKPEDRREARLAGEWRAWLTQMSEPEKAELLELTLPSGVTQMLSAFEQMPEAQRRRSIEDSLRRLREARLQNAEAGEGGNASPDPGEDPFATLSPEARDRIVSKGLKTFMDEGSADTRAQLQPLVEELQRNMETGGSFRNRRRLGPPK